MVTFRGTLHAEPNKQTTKRNQTKVDDKKQGAENDDMPFMGIDSMNSILSIIPFSQTWEAQTQGDCNFINLYRLQIFKAIYSKPSNFFV